MAALQCRWLCLFLLPCLLSTTVLAVSLVVIPSNNQVVPETSEDNVTFVCNVTGIALDNVGMVIDSTGTDAIWEVQGSQIQNFDTNNPIRDTFATIGVFVNVIELGVTELIITRQARTLYRANGNDVDLRCVARLPTTPPSTQFGDMLSVITFGPPSIPTGLSLDPADPNDLSELVFSWLVPAQQPAGVNITYQPVISGLSINLSNSTQLTSVMFRDEISSLDCRPHNFTVSASNLAGTGPVAFIERTIPISPDLTALIQGFKINSVSLADPITLSITVPLATTCSSAFPILSYSLVSPSSSLLAPVMLGNGSSLGAEVNTQVTLPGLAQDVQLLVFIEVCIDIACRRSDNQLLRTSDTQNATITFFENNVQFQCKFSLGSLAMGCIFQLSVGGNATEMFVLQRGGSAEVTLCQQTMNQGDIYDSTTVSDVEGSGETGTLVINVVPVFLEDVTSYTTITTCTIPQPKAALSTGGVVGIVLAALLLGIVVLVVVVLVLVYRVRTGHWFKIIVKDDDLLTVHFEKELLMADPKPSKKKSKEVVSPGVGNSSRDMELHNARTESQPTSSAPSNTQKSDTDAGPTLVDEVDGTVGGDGEGEVVTSATAPLLSSALPGHAFTLDISADRKKVRLHMNRAVIKRALRDKNLKTMPRKQPRLQRQKSDTDAGPTLVDEVDGTVGGDGEGEVVTSATAPLLSSALPGHAFTLDISADRKKVRLHMNRAVIKRALRDKNLKTMPRKQPRLQRQASTFKLPLSCEMRVQVQEEGKPATSTA